ncbi:MAG: hypothetical protein HY323_10170 [Betaproteobacteria bacterium]|nr:hypothetical protein [Betaproteobacteria bacterium]
MLKVLLSVLIAAVSLTAAAAEKYPSRPIRMVVGLPPGGPTDLAARLTGQKLTDALGIEPEGNTPEEFARQVREETAKWGRIIKAAGVRPN